MSAEPHERRVKQGNQSDERRIAPVVCPFCGSADTELIALFGLQLSTSQHQCRACLSYFEAMKQDDRD